MKKRKIRSLSLKKTSVATLNHTNKVTGGNEPTNTFGIGCTTNTIQGSVCICNTIRPCPTTEFPISLACPTLP